MFSYLLNTEALASKELDKSKHPSSLDPDLKLGLRILFQMLEAGWGMEVN